MRLGIVSAASGTLPAGPYTLNPVHYESDWTTGSIPTGWTADTTPPYANGTYTGTGVHIAVGETNYRATRSITPRAIGAYVWMAAYYVNGSNGSSINGRVHNQLTDPPSTNHDGYLQLGVNNFGDDTRSELDDHDQWNSRASEQRVVWAPASQEIVVKVLKMDEAGNVVSYILTAEGHVQQSVSTGTPFDPLAEQISDFEVTLNLDSGTESDMRLAHTYVGIDEELTTAQIKTIATGWGWTESAFSAGSPEQTNASWTSSLPGTWNASPLHSGATVVHAADGTYVDEASVAIKAYFYQDTAKEYTNKLTVAWAFKYSGASETNDALGVGSTIGTMIYANADSLNPLGFGCLFENGAGDGFLNPIASTGVFYVALTVDFTNGNYNLYLIENGEPTQSLAGASASLPNFITAEPWLRLTGSADTPADIKVVHTYVGLDEAKNQAALETIASGWGWTP